MKLVILALLLSMSTRSFAGPDVIDGPPSRELRPPTRIDFGPPPRGPTPAEPPARPVDPVPPQLEGTDVGVLGSLIGAPLMMYVLVKVYADKAGPTATRDGWRKDRRRSGYASLLPDLRKVRKVSFVPSATADSVQTGVALRW